jgi:hypothetical protein
VGWGGGLGDATGEAWVVWARGTRLGGLGFVVVVVGRRRRRDASETDFSKTRTCVCKWGVPRGWRALGGVVCERVCVARVCLRVVGASAARARSRFGEEGERARANARRLLPCRRAARSSPGARVKFALLRPPLPSSSQLQPPQLHAHALNHAQNHLLPARASIDARSSPPFFRSSEASPPPTKRERERGSTALFAHGSFSRARNFERPSPTSEPSSSRPELSSDRARPSCWLSRVPRDRAQA